jgi:hypothetical protein
MATQRDRASFRADPNADRCVGIALNRGSRTGATHRCLRKATSADGMYCSSHGPDATPIPRKITLGPRQIASQRVALIEALREMTDRFEALCALTQTTGVLADTTSARAILRAVDG